MFMTFTVMVMALTGWLLLRVAPFSSSGRSSSSGKGGGAVLIAILVGGGMYLFGRLFGLILQNFVSRQREYAADAKSARIMGTPKPLMSALEKICGNPSVGTSTVGAACGFLCTADPDPSDMFSTHPSMPKRLRALQALETA